MSLLSALNTATTGLKANQVGLDIVSRNIANASTPGYTKKVAPRENALVDRQGRGVRILATERQVDFRLTQNLRLEESRSARLNTVSAFLRRVDEMFGRPEQQTSIAYGVSELSTRMGQLVDNSSDPGVRAAVLDQASALARQLNQMSAAIQDMRTEAENKIGFAVEQVNGALKGIEALNREIANRTAGNLTTADLEDRRDAHLKVLAENLDIRYIQRGDGQITVFTNSGHTLVNEKAAQIRFDSRGFVQPTDQFNINPAESGVGTLTLVSAGGTEVNLLADGPPRQGAIAGLLELRDERLVEAQAQLDELAHSLALALSERQTNFTTGYSADFSTVPALADGDRFTFTYMEGGRERTVTAYAVTNMTGQSLTDLRSRVPDPDNAVFVDLSAMAGPPPVTAAQAVYNALAPQLPAGLLTDPGGTNVMSVSPGSESLVRSMMLRSTSTNTLEGPQLALFADGTSASGMQQVPYTGSISGPGFAKTGFAARISVNQSVLADDTKLVVYDRGSGDLAPLGDMTRPQELLDRLSEMRLTYSASTGLGQANNPFTGTLLDFARTVVSYQGSEAASVKQLTTDQNTRTQLLSERFESESGVNVDDEMAQLILLQSNYAASAKVVQTVNRMLDDLMSIMR
ncbi:flagellar hook-associated protein FlgK [Caenispirillum bisanense]|uniref:flagellar hook-associated protein FlgK n=1 Tax=Caenispirillum bisanense TaxID=414052 RepID=UPI0031E076CA